jgi:flagellar biosynthesis protein FliQ
LVVVVVVFLAMGAWMMSVVVAFARQMIASVAGM